MSRRHTCITLRGDRARDVGGYDECAEIVLTFATHGDPNTPPELVTVIYSWNEGTDAVVAIEPDEPVAPTSSSS